jgi:RNA polymerase sigma-70 factor (ECF subfamily)
VRDEHAALDIVQDAMMKLAENYAMRPATEFPMLFQRILQNTMRDFWRRQKVRNIWTSLLSSFSVTGEDGEDSDPLEVLTSADPDARYEPEVQLEQRQTMALI